MTASCWARWKSNLIEAHESVHAGRVHLWCAEKRPELPAFSHAQKNKYLYRIVFALPCFWPPEVLFQIAMRKVKISSFSTQKRVEFFGTENVKSWAPVFSQMLNFLYLFFRVKTKKTAIKSCLSCGADKRTWTSTELPRLEPESNASANSAISAYSVVFVSCDARNDSYYTRCSRIVKHFFKKLFIFWERIILSHFLQSCSSAVSCAGIFAVFPAAFRHS